MDRIREYLDLFKDSVLKKEDVPASLIQNFKSEWQSLGLSNKVCGWMTPVRYMLLIIPRLRETYSEEDLIGYAQSLMDKLTEDARPINKEMMTAVLVVKIRNIDENAPEEAIEVMEASMGKDSTGCPLFDEYFYRTLVKLYTKNAAKNVLKLPGTMQKLAQANAVVLEIPSAILEL